MKPRIPLSCRPCFATCAGSSRKSAKISTALSDQVKIAALNTEHPGHFADLIAANLGLPLAEKQALLETVSVRERLQKLLPLLNREQEVLELSSKIQNDVASNISKTQRDFFLREQMRAIQRELGDTDPNVNEIKTSAKKSSRPGCPTRRARPPTRNWTGCSRRRPPPPNTAWRAITSTGFSRCRGRRKPRTSST
jgi:ATP-dependent Lon protease